MSDLISRQVTIKAIEDLQDCYNGFSDTYDKACIIGVIEEVPSIEPNSCEYWDSESHFCALRRPQAVLQRAYDQGVKDALDKYDETFRIASDIRCAVGCKTVKECRDLISNGEIQRVKHGRWIGLNRNRYNDDEATCSICGSTFASGYSDPSWWDYCPNCGADMRDGEK